MLYIQYFLNFKKYLDKDLVWGSSSLSTWGTFSLRWKPKGIILPINVGDIHPVNDHPNDYRNLHRGGIELRTCHHKSLVPNRYAIVTIMVINEFMEFF